MPRTARNCRSRMLLREPRVDRRAHFVELPREKMIRAFDDHEPLRFWKLRENRLHFVARPVFVIPALDDQFRLRTLLQKCQFGHIYRKPKPNQLHNARIRATHPHAHGRTKTESGDKYRPSRKFPRQIIERRPHVLLLATPFVVNSFAQARPSKIESQDRNSKFVQSLRRLKNHFVVHRPAEKRMWMADHRDEGRLRGRRRPKQRFEPPRRTREKKFTMENFSHGGRT